MKDESVYFIEMLKRMVDIKNSDEFTAEITGTAATHDLFNRTEGYYNTALEWQQKLKISSKAYTVAGVDIKDLTAKHFSITAIAMSSLGEKKGIADLINLKTAYTYTNLLRKTPEDILFLRLKYPEYKDEEE